MRTTKTLLDYMAEDFWTIRIPKPRVSRATVRWTAALALSLGFNVGFLAEAYGAERFQPTVECLASADLHYHISGGQDAAWEDSLEACNEGMTYTEWTSYEPSECEELAGAAYDLTGVPADYETTEAACEALAEAF